MPWIKIDDGLFVHPKWVQTPPAARGLWITVLSYCGKMMTDGFVPAGLLQMLGGTPEDAEALVCSGLWETTENGFKVHDFAAYNPVKAEIAVKRAEAGRKGAEARWAKTAASQNGKTIAKNSKRIAGDSKGITKMPPEPEPVSVSGLADLSTSLRDQPPQSPPQGGDDDSQDVDSFTPKPLPAGLLDMDRILTDHPYWRGELEFRTRNAGNPARLMQWIVRAWLEGREDPPPPHEPKPVYLTAEILNRGLPTTIAKNRPVPEWKQKQLDAAAAIAAEEALAPSQPEVQSQPATPPAPRRKRQEENYAS